MGFQEFFLLSTAMDRVRRWLLSRNIVFARANLHTIFVKKISKYIKFFVRFIRLWSVLASSLTRLVLLHTMPFVFFYSIRDPTRL